jgi:2-dehydro-3-deoxygalactonokinase
MAPWQSVGMHQPPSLDAPSAAPPGARPDDRPDAAPHAAPQAVPTARLIAIDWGSSRLRAWLLGDAGTVLAERGSDGGASRLVGGGPAFAAALQSLAGDWLAQRLPAIACGMVGSAHGWREARYVTCPAALAELHRHTVTVDTPAGTPLHIVPGLLDEPADGTPDVMRGEETQLAGLLALDPERAAQATVLMPGTHSKWVRLQDSRVQGFRTRITGELYAVLREHSVLGRLMPAMDDGREPRSADRGDSAPAGRGGAQPQGFTDDLAEAFDAGVAAARGSAGADLGAQLFAVRTLGLTGRMRAEALPDYLSGLLIGHELAAALQTGGPPLLLVGDPALCRRYGRALQAFGVQPAAVHGNTAIAGLWQLAQQAHL